MFLIAAALAASSPAAAQPAPAADAMVGADVDQVAKVLTDEGYKAKIETDEDGDRYIKSASGGRNFTIYMLGCGGGVKKGPCNSVEFYAGFTLGTPFPLERTNEWNHKNRYGRSYVDASKDPVVEMDLYLDTGAMPRKLFVENLEIWFDVMANFDAFVFDDGSEGKKAK